MNTAMALSLLMCGALWGHLLPGQTSCLRGLLTPHLSVTKHIRLANFIGPTDKIEDVRIVKSLQHS